MVELTTHQGSVGRVLRAGAALLGEGNLSEEEDSEIREQMNLLNSRWEHLRVASMERQSRYEGQNHSGPQLAIRLLIAVSQKQQCKIDYPEFHKFF